MELNYNNSVWLDFDFVLQSTSIGATSVSIRYTVPAIEGVVNRANITTVFTGPCPDAIPTRTLIISGFSNSSTINNLEEYSFYDVIVTLVLGNGRTAMGMVHIPTQGTSEQ